jgi:Omp85 superfamily domain/Calcineurin-like phosphoesterase
MKRGHAIGLFCALLLGGLAAHAQQLLHRIVLIGDAGEIKGNQQPAVVAALAAGHLTAQSTVVFLGDNIYPAGLPDKDAKGYDKYKAILEAQLRAARQSPAQVYFIPGNHDWAKGRGNGAEVALNQQRYIDSAQLPNAHFIPANGCPGPEETPLAPGVVLVTINSQWWLQGSGKPGPSSACDCKTGDEVAARLKDIAYRHRNSIIILTSHHPFRTYGPHGGYFTLKQHIFPFTDANPYAWVPLPVIGSIYPIARSVFGNVQDVQHPAYKKMIAQVTEALQQHPAVYFVHGHDHNLQHIRYNNSNYIVSGSGAKTNRVKKGKYSAFAAAQEGYAVLDMMDDHSVKLNFYGLQNQLLYSYQQAHAAPPPLAANLPTGSAAVGDSVVASAGSRYNKAGGLKRWLFGQTYRQVWAVPQPFRVFQLTKEQGGLKIVQRGGGKQTKSLRLEDKTGKQWVIRSIDKNPVSALPPALQESFALDIVQDQISAAHPYAPLVVPVLAEAAGIPHANPELVWIPADTALGGHFSDFANTLCLFEEREPGITGKSYSTAKVLENLEEDNDDKVDQLAVLKARLFDMFIGDWDRHEDQWRWGAAKAGKGKTYYPVPRDRDQAFFINNGLITKMAAAPYLVPSVQGFRKKYRNINTFNFSTRYFDRNFLNEPSEQQWQQAAEAMVAAITDEVIDKAIARLPKAVQQISGAALSQTLKGKRHYFVQDAMTYYRFLAKTIEVVGSDKKERFTLQPATDGQLLLQVHKVAKNEEAPVLLYQRTINPQHTKELRLYGRGGADQFVTDSLANAKLKLRIIGGKGKDAYQTAAPLPTRIYDLEKEENDLSAAGNAKLRTSNNPAVNQYNRTAFQYNQNIPGLAAGFNPDDGLSLGAGIKLIRHGFRKAPAAVYRFSATHSLSTSAFRFRANALFNQVLGKTAIALYADIKSPNNTTNFFGYGNASVYNNPGKNTFRFHRARYNLIEGGANLVTRLGKSIQLQYGAGYQFFSMDADDNANRYILQTGINGLAGDRILDRKHYLMGNWAIQIDNRNQPNLPTRGVNWITNMQVAKGLNGASKNTLTLQSDLRFYASLNNPAKLVLAARLGGGHVIGDFEFFQAMQLGNHDNLRGYRNHRFAGRSMAYTNVELRMKLFDFAGYLFPGTVGLIAFNDAGRAWYKKGESATWHNTPGVGLYVAPAGLVVISGTVGFSREETLPYVTVGFRF